MCSAHAAVRGFVGALVAHREAGTDTVMDMEAGLEHLSRGTGRYVDTVVAVLEPYYRSLETGRRVVDLAGELGIGRAFVVANKLRSPSDRDAVLDFCERHGLDLLEEVPFDESLLEAERKGRSPADHDPDSPAARAVGTLATSLRERLDG